MILNNKYSDYKIVWFPEKLSSLKSGEIKAPIYLRIKPTNRCNQSCYYCIYNKEFSNMKKGIVPGIDEISKDKMFEILDDVSSIGVKAITYSGGGEPLLHKDIVDILIKTLDVKIDLSILTNGELLKDARADVLSRAKWVRISSDYNTPELFKLSREGNEKRFKNIIENITKFSKIVANYKTHCDIGINYIITKDNYKGVIDATKLYMDCGINNIRFSPVWTPDFYNYHKDIMEEIRELLNTAKQKFASESFFVYDSYNISSMARPRCYHKCYFMQIVSVIGADCNVYNCHNKSYDETGKIGSIKNQKFSDLWFSESTKKYFEEFDGMTCNHQCANDKKNIFIHEIINSYGDNYV